MTLTKKLLLEKFQPVVREFKHESVGSFFVKPRTELQRCKRIGDMYDSKGNAIPDQIARRRTLMIVDQICDSDGKALFNEGDVKDLLALDSDKLDPILEGIADVNGELEKNDSGA